MATDILFYLDILIYFYSYSYLLLHEVLNLLNKELKTKCLPLCLESESTNLGRRREPKKREKRRVRYQTQVAYQHFFKRKNDPTSNSIAEVEDDSFCDNAEKYLVNSSICPESSHSVTDDKDENFAPSEVCSTSEAMSADKKKDLVFDTTRKFPTDRGHFTENITDRDLKTLIMQHESCRPLGPFEYVDDEGNAIVNFSARYYSKYIDNMSVQRLWLCYSIVMQKPYCEVCWLFADRSSPNYGNHRGWVNGVSGSLHNMLAKIKRHETSNMHIQATAVYMRWKSGKTVDKDDEKEIRNNALFWVKVLDRIITIILTLATLTLAFRGHDEHVRS